MVNGVARPRSVYLRGLRGGKILNTNATLSKSILGHFGGYLENSFAANSLGEHYGAGAYMQDLIPF